MADVERMKSYRVWKNFRDSATDIAVLVDAFNASEAERKAVELMGDEKPFGGESEHIGYTVEPLC